VTFPLGEDALSRKYFHPLAQKRLQRLYFESEPWFIRMYENILGMIILYQSFLRQDIDEVTRCALRQNYPLPG
jgi:hypothetical protein